MKKISSPFPFLLLFRFYILIFFTLIFSNLHAQNWLHENHVWQYEITHSWFPQQDGLFDLQIIGDTVIQGIECKVFSNSHGNLDRYAYEEGETVYTYDHFESEFRKIYDFTLSAGDTLVIKDNWMYFIEEIGTIQINSLDRRYQKVSLNFLGGDFIILEGIGIIGKSNLSDPTLCGYFFMDRGFCNSAFDGDNYYFRCFSNGDYLFSPYAECDLTNDNKTFSSKINISPNPAINILNIEYNGPHLIHEIQLIDQLGKAHSIKINPLKQINISQFVSGLYFLKIKFNNGTYHTEKLIISK